MRVLFYGTPRFALPTLEALLASHEVVGVVTQPDRPAGRGRRVTAPPVKERAARAERDLGTAQPADADPPARRRRDVGAAAPEGRRPPRLARAGAGGCEPDPRLQPLAWRRDGNAGRAPGDLAGAGRVAGKR